METCIPCLCSGPPAPNRASPVRPAGSGGALPSDHGPPTAPTGAGMDREERANPDQSPETSFAIVTSCEMLIGSATLRNSAMQACSPWNFTASSSV